MAKPPNTPPHSDLDGVREDELDNIEAANAAGQDAADLKRAAGESKGRPDRSAARGGRDDRSR